MKVFKKSYWCLEIKLIQDYQRDTFTNYGKKFVLRGNTHNVRNFQEIFNENRKIVKYGI